MPGLFAALIRHGDYRQLADTPSAHQPFALTGLGAAQAGEAAVTLRADIDKNGWRLCPAVDSSCLLRAWQTARIICDELAESFSGPAQLCCHEELAERGLGSAANLSIRQIETVIDQDPRFPALPPDWKSNSHFRLPLQGAESLLEAGARVASHLDRSMRALAADVETDTLKLFVGHGAAFRHAAFKLGVLEFEQIARLSMHHARPVILEYSAQGNWRHVGGEWKVRGAAGEFRG